MQQLLKSQQNQMEIRDIRQLLTQSTQKKFFSKIVFTESTSQASQTQATNEQNDVNAITQLQNRQPHVRNLPLIQKGKNTTS